MNADTKKTALKKTAPKKNAEPASFEDALERLEEVNEKLEQGEPTLEEAIDLYTEGMKLAKFCRDRLGRAEKQIKILLEKNGAMVEADFEDKD